MTTREVWAMGRKSVSGSENITCKSQSCGKRGKCANDELKGEGGCHVSIHLGHRIMKFKAGGAPIKL